MGGFGSGSSSSSRMLLQGPLARALGDYHWVSSSSTITTTTNNNSNSNSAIITVY